MSSKVVHFQRLDAEARRPARIRFGDYEFDLERQELFRGSRPVAIRAQSVRILALLVGNAGHIVSREEIQQSVWGPETHVDFDQGINHCIRQIRSLLDDAADSPRFVETVAKRGYRFIASVTPVEHSRTPERPRETPGWLLSWRTIVLIAALAAVAAIVLVWRVGFPSLGASTRPPTLVVLPFQDLSEDDSLFDDALTEELITQLGRRYSGRMGVIARTSAMQFKETTKGIDEIGRLLDADYILEGSVRHSGERIRITAQLIRSADASHLWAANFDRTVSDVIDIQQEVSEKIALALGLKLLPADSRGPSAATTAEAYQAYLEGKARLYDYDPEAPRRHIEALGRSVALDPGFAPAWALLAEALRRQPLPPSEKIPSAKAAVEKALALDETLPEAQLTLANILFYYDWDLPGARRAFERAVDLHPAYAEAWHAYAAYFSVTGDHDAALNAVQRARAFDPLSPMVTSDVGWYSYFARRYEEAVDRCRETLAQAPGFYWGHRCVVFASLMLGDTETAVAQMRTEMQQRGASETDLAMLDADDPERALEAYWFWDLERQQRWGETYYISPSALGQIHLARGDHARALTAFEQALGERSGWILPFLRVDPMADPLRDDARFTAILEAMQHRNTTLAAHRQR